MKSADAGTARAIGLSLREGLAEIVGVECPGVVGSFDHRGNSISGDRYHGAFCVEESIS